MFFSFDMKIYHFNEKCVFSLTFFQPVPAEPEKVEEKAEEKKEGGVRG